MIKLLHFMLTTLLSENISPRQNQPARLEKRKENTFITLLNKACPYIILACLIIFGILLFVALVKNGHVFSTEANNYYNNFNV